MTRDSLDALVVGGGAFGTALASQLSRLGRRTLLWVRRPEQAEEINQRHTNQRYLPGCALPEALRATNDLAAAVHGAPLLLVAVPSREFRGVAKLLGDCVEGDHLLVHVAKGIERGSFKRMSQVLREETCALKIGVLSGPNLAPELMAGHPAGAQVASRFREVVQRTQALFAGGRLRVYGGADVVGTEVGGAFKNIIALAGGVADGMGFGDNTKSLLVTRGLGEMARYGVAVGADVFTFGGLAGIGDLMATCASALSRNHQVGERLGRGEALDAILASMPHVVEGVTTTQAVHPQALAMKLALPIVGAVHGMLFEGWSPRDAVERLMALPVGDELFSLRYR
ncbi:MAG TPA: NAD(P)H-dependent glycerol-3-phosphate dehydrogenase [Myxococcota bacterium]|nr:NAD(P)H-dependent glycerol-3-phosphate dehydrogenase [Myxococcota bacterium]HRY94195.1 NAD(P)H-dependent glycerol-3-phosphate dehydrogenase [Myxococcota bacterium]HSA23937.1 NAD(P)H-dependent glycerol-3-phosphate dehydrogenase [Myxococcota bacterium]